MECNIRNLEGQVKRLQTRKTQCSISTQTLSTIDTPYTVSEQLPPIFGSQLCRLSKSVFLSKSVPDLATITWVTQTEEDKQQEEAEDALNYMYNLEIAKFYSEAKEKAAARRRLEDNDSGGD